MNNNQDPLIKRHESNWYKRAQVSKAIPYEKIEFEPEKWDFLPELMPFHSHPLWRQVPEKQQRLVASYGWLMYNMRTIYIENQILSPLCHSILERKNYLTAHFDCLRVISQTLTDESYHTLLSLEGIQGIFSNRKLDKINFPIFNFIRNYQNSLSQSENLYEKEIMQFGIVIASEVLISDYLSLIAKSEIIQPLCRMVTHTHWKDEMAHGHVFKLISEKIIFTLTPFHKDLFIHSIIQAAKWFCDKEFEIWKIILKYAGIYKNDEIIFDTENLKPLHPNQLIDKRVILLANNLKNM